MKSNTLKRIWNQVLLGVLYTSAFLFLCCSPKDSSPHSLPFDTTSLDSLNQEKREAVLDSLYRYTIPHPLTSADRDHLLELTSVFELYEHTEHLPQLYREIEELSHTIQDSVYGFALERLGYFYEDHTLYDSAYYYYTKAENFYSQLSDSTKVAEMALNKASVLYDAGIFTESEDEAFRALSFFESQRDTGYLYECYQLLGLILCELKDFDNALHFYSKTASALQKIEQNALFEPEDISFAYAALYNNIGGVYEIQREFEQALHYYQKGLHINKIKDTHPNIYATLLNNIYNIRSLKGKTADVLPNLIQAHKIRDSIGHKDGVLMSEVTLAEYYMRAQDTLNTLRHLHDAYAISKESDVYSEAKKVLKYLILYDPENSPGYLESYIQVSDKIRAQEQAAKNKFARIAYETDALQAKHARLQNRATYTLIGIAIAVLFFLFIVRSYLLRLKNKQLLLENKQRESNEHIYQLIIQKQQSIDHARTQERQRIAQELHDGIVNSIFTTRFNLMQLDTPTPSYKELLVKELQKTEREVRSLSHTLSKENALPDAPFPQLIKELIAQQKNDFETEFSLRLDETIDWISYSGNQKMNIYRIIQESLQNINTHSKASQASIELNEVSRTLQLSITDNGIGMNPKFVKRGTGLRNIENRCREMGASFNLTSTEGTGTKIQISIKNEF